MSNQPFDTWLGVGVMPEEEGLWEITCTENAHEPEAVALIDHPERGLQVYDRHLGVQPLKHYHDGLTEINWRRLA